MKKSNNPLVTIIVPSYNHKDFIEESILSITNQTYKNIELIIIDDGSLDGSVELLNELSSKFNFKFITRENKGVSATLNEGIKLSNGEYICICASDDKLVLDKTEKQVSFMELNKDYAIAYGNKINFYTNGLTRNICDKNFKSGYIFDDLFLQKFYIPPVSVIYRKEVFNEVGYFDENLAEEGFDMFLKISKKFKIAYMNEYFYYYRTHENNTINNIEKMEHNTNVILEKWKDEMLYNESILRKKIIYFRNYAATKKIKALKQLPLSLNIFSNRIFYQGVMRLIIPKKLYNIIRGK